MTSRGIVRKVNEIMVEGFEIDPSELKPEAHLDKDLGLDSLDSVDLVVAIEKAFGCRVDEAEARSMYTLKDIYDYLQKHMHATHEGADE